MQLLRLYEAHFTPGQPVFRQSILVRVVFSALLCGLAVAVWFFHRHGLPLLIAILFLVLFGLAALTAVYDLLRSLSFRSNWLLTFAPGGVLVKFRSYANAHFPENDPQVALIPFSEIVSARVTKQTVTADRTEFMTYLDLRVRSPNLDELKARLTSEQRVKTAHRTLDCPVTVRDGSIVRITWRSGSSRVVPGIGLAVKALERRQVQIESSGREECDLTDPARLKREELEKRLLEMAEGGRLFEAVKLASRAYGLDTTRAKEFVDGLLK